MKVRIDLQDQILTELKEKGVSNSCFTWRRTENYKILTF